MIYTFRDTNTDEVIEVEMRLSELDSFKENNQHLKQIISAAPLSYSGSGFNLKVDDGFREVISKTEERLGKKINKSGKWG